LVEYDASFDDIANGTIDVPSDDAAKRVYVIQQQLFELLKANPDFATQNSNLQSFIQNNSWSNLDFIYYTDKYLAKADLNTVEILLASWPQFSTDIDANYYKFYDWLYTMYTTQGWQPNPTDVLNLANKCPLKDGNIVYAARNLYNTMTGKINEFSGDCEGYSGMLRKAQPITKNSVSSNEVLVYPNPTAGVVNIQLPKDDKGCWKLVVTNIYGEKVIEKQLMQKEGATQLSLSGSKGLYVINVYNCTTGKQYISKVVLQ